MTQQAPQGQTNAAQTKDKEDRAKAGAAARAAAAAAAAKAGEAPREEHELETDVGGYTLGQIAEVSGWQREGILDLLDGKRPAIGPNLAVVGFFQKAPGAQIAGIIRVTQERRSRFEPYDLKTVHFIEGIVRYERDVIDPRNGDVLIEAGDYEGIFGFQTDAATASLEGGMGHSVVNSRVHIKVKGRETTRTGLTRYNYDFARMLAVRA